MSEDDPFEDLDISEDPMADLDRATVQLSIRTETRRYGKPVTIIDGFDGAIDVDALASELKSALGTGGTATATAIELQGDHVARVRDELSERGYQVDG